MATALRRLLMLAALGFWQGGFTFYATVVVPLGEQVLGSSVEQGFVTRRVTNYLNLAGAAALPLLLWDMAVTERKSRLRAVAWLVMALALGALAWLHPRLDHFLDAKTMDVLDHDRFYAVHEVYLTICALQWAGALVFLFATLRAWHVDALNRAADQAPHAA